MCYKNTKVTYRFMYAEMRAIRLPIDLVSITCRACWAAPDLFSIIRAAKIPIKGSCQGVHFEQLGSNFRFYTPLNSHAGQIMNESEDDRCLNDPFLAVRISKELLA